MLMTPGDCLYIWELKIDLLFTACIHLRLPSFLKESGWKVSGPWVPREAGTCVGWGETLHFCSEIGTERGLSWRLCIEEEKGSSGHGGFLLDWETLRLDDAKNGEVRLFAWAGWMHRNKLMHTTQPGIAVRLKHVPKASSSDDHQNNLWILAWV